MNFVEKKFNECFSDKNYKIEPPVFITSQVDKTVDFVGSKISPLKHYIIDENIPKEGVALIQNCMKLRALKYLKNNIQATFGSCYRGMGTLTQFDLDKIVYDTFDYLLNTKYLGINPKDICIRLSSNDLDLIKSTTQVDSAVIREYDTENIDSYKHIYGMDEEGITGRNFNIAIRKGESDEFFDCAAIIVMETAQKKIAIDMGIGNTSLAMCYFNTNDTVSSSRIADIIDINSVEMMKFADSIVATSTLLYEGILEHSSKHFRKKFRQYIQVLKYWREQINVSDKTILDYMNRYLYLEYGVDKMIDEKTYSKILNNK